MQPLTDLIQFVPAVTTEETPEDIFSSAPGLIFPDDLLTHHGEPGALLIYHSAKYGPVEVQTADPVVDTDRRLFGHYLWNAGVLMAERISGERLLDRREVERWSVKGQRVLELGAGVGLTGIVASLAGAEEVVSSDYPTDVILANVKSNVLHNAAPLEGHASVMVQGHEWGVFEDDFSSTMKHHFTRVLAADCFWMPQVHEELAQSMLHFLSLDPSSSVLVIGGFHTGRAKLAAFFDAAALLGLAVEDIYEEDSDGRRRPWAKERDGGREDHTGRKRWLMTAILRRRQA
ncbi:Protein N-methyltransferase nnt1 [Sphaceloma murrayae]|uniref:Protein N-methyltransferase nnt1 n=1 Tax=Sphaceloma murrayae TaxID=2082308 RepID=A0A2K1QMB9_9PEZI|nr:Protein N-methyltransferase nnt1 [Sphaceloma murrayae]